MEKENEEECTSILEWVSKNHENVKCQDYIGFKKIGNEYLLSEKGNENEN